MIRILLVLVAFIFMLGACTQRLICPAYQSAFIFDKEALRKKFSYMKEDSTPKILTVSKTKYLIAVPESYRKKLRNLQTVEMKPIYPEIPDSLKIDEGEEFLMAERDVTDSAATESGKGVEPGDSTYAITKTKEKYNLDQDIYMWYFRDILVLPDVRASLEEKKSEKAGNTSATKVTGKKKSGGWLKGLFKKKAKDSTAVSSQAASDSSAVKDQPKPEKKKGKRRKQADEKQKDAAKKEEGDGF